MLESIIQFFNTSLATLSIYDTLIIILFALALILTIASGVIILSARVKKINLELERSKSIQFINERIIQNRLDLILNKLRKTESYLRDTQFMPISGITNNNIKHSIIENDENNEGGLDNNNENNAIISIPYVNKEDNTATYPEAIDNNNVSEEDGNSKDAIITYNTQETNEDDNANNLEKNITLNKNAVFDDGQLIPLEVDNEIELINNRSEIPDENVQEESSNHQEPTKEITKANDFLNSMNAFKNEDKFKITENIKDDGTCIKCFIRNEYYNLTYKELIRQLLIQNLVTHYKYPLSMISLNYRLSRSIDVAVIISHSPYIIALIDNPNRPKRFQLLKNLTLASNARFAIWCNGHTITCYSMNNGYLEEVSDIPVYQENASSHAANPAYTRQNRPSLDYSGSFYRDSNNIYRNTTTPSTIYQPLIQRSKSLSSTNNNNDRVPSINNRTSVASSSYQTPYTYPGETKNNSITGNFPPNNTTYSVRDYLSVD